MRVSRIIMGTGVSIDIPDAEETILEEVFKRLEEIDGRFSTYKTTSEASRFIKGEIVEKDLSRDLKKIIKACKTAEAETAGYFSAWASGSFEPSGYVKGWAIAEAAKVIKKNGFKTFCIGIGGDIVASSNSDKIWKIGIQDPRDKNSILATVAAKNIAVATSGTSARGLHIINPKTGKPADSILSITVVGPNIIDADVRATAGFVMGARALQFIEKQPDYEALMVDKNGQISMTSGFADYLDSSL